MVKVIAPSPFFFVFLLPLLGQESARKIEEDCGFLHKGRTFLKSFQVIQPTEPLQRNLSVAVSGKHRSAWWPSFYAGIESLTFLWIQQRLILTTAVPQASGFHPVEHPLAEAPQLVAATWKINLSNVTKPLADILWYWVVHRDPYNGIRISLHLGSIILYNKYPGAPTGHCWFELEIQIFWVEATAGSPQRSRKGSTECNDFDLRNSGGTFEKTTRSSSFCLPVLNSHWLHLGIFGCVEEMGAPPLMEHPFFRSLKLGFIWQHDLMMIHDLWQVLETNILSFKLSYAMRCLGVIWFVVAVAVAVVGEKNYVSLPGVSGRL